MNLHNDGPISGFLLWLLHHMDYHHVIIIKNTLTDVSAVMFGIIIGILFIVSLGKDTRLVPSPNVEGISVARIDKDKRKKVFITVPQDQAARLPFITGVVLWFYVALVRLLPVKKLQLVDSRRIRIGWTITLVIIISVCVFNMMLDSHVILPDGSGGYSVYNRFNLYDVHQ
jgi:hypothetical protein